MQQFLILIKQIGYLNENLTMSVVYITNLFDIDKTQDFLLLIFVQNR